LALAAAMEEMSEEELIPHNANLAEYLDDGYLGELSSESAGAYEDDLSSRSEWEEAYTQGPRSAGRELPRAYSPLSRAPRA
jgi:hypothetical protein